MTPSDGTWSTLLALRAACADGRPRRPVLVVYDYGFEFVNSVHEVFVDDPVAVFCHPDVDAGDWASTTLVDQQLQMLMPAGSDPARTTLMRLYVPLASARHFFPGRVFVVAHMAQTLDGKVSTDAGISKWIGNQANLAHAHRMRALIDGVVVGGVTAQVDRPSLNVRHVDGPNPARIILSSTFQDVADLPVVSDSKTILVRSADDGSHSKYGTDCDVIPFAGPSPDIVELLDAFRSRGIHSILIEGGPTTLQSFLGANAVDIVQLHIAPIFFGSGKTVMRMPGIETVDDALPLRNSFWVPMGDGMMITGQV